MAAAAAAVLIAVVAVVVVAVVAAVVVVAFGSEPGLFCDAASLRLVLVICCSFNDESILAFK